MLEILRGMAVAVAVMSGAWAQDPASLQEDLIRAGKFLEGRYDNYEQNYWEVALGIPESLRHRQSSSIYRRVSLPAFGDHVYYADKYWDGDPAKVAYRNLYVLKVDQDLKAIRLDLLTIPNAARLDRAQSDLSVLDQLTPQEMIRMEPNCNTVWRRWADHFRVTMAGECILTTVHPSKAPISVKVDTMLDGENFWYLSFGHGQDGSLMYGPPDLVPSFDRRAREFTCDVSSKEGTAKGLKLHDQGGSAKTILGKREVALRLRQLKWPADLKAQGDRRDGLALFVIGKGEDEDLLGTAKKPAPYVVTGPRARTIELNLSDVQARCSAS